jgi:hypothetical protein
MFPRFNDADSLVYKRNGDVSIYINIVYGDVPSFVFSACVEARYDDGLYSAVRSGIFDPVLVELLALFSGRKHIS